MLFQPCVNGCLNLAQMHVPLIRICLKLSKFLSSLVSTLHHSYRSILTCPRLYPSPPAQSPLPLLRMIYSIKSLSNFINSLNNTPRHISNPRGDVGAVQSAIKSLKLMLENQEDESFPTELQVCLSSAKIPLEECQVVYADFEQKLNE